MDEYDCPRMVYSSSATVYGTPPEIPIPETTRLKADSPYGKTKVMCETILEDLCGGALCPFPSENSPAQATQFFFLHQLTLIDGVLCLSDISSRYPLSYGMPYGLIRRVLL